MCTYFVHIMTICCTVRVRAQVRDKPGFGPNPDGRAALPRKYALRQHRNLIIQTVSILVEIVNIGHRLYPYMTT